MLSKQVIMREWREFVRRRDRMALLHATPPAAVPPNSPDSPTLVPGSPVRAPASLCAL